MSDSTKSAQLTLGNKTYELPVLHPTAGPDVLDVTKLYAQANVFTYDPGFTSTASCDSAITFIDGDKGELLYRGYPIEQLAEYSSHLEVCYLLLYGELPNKDQLHDFNNRVTRHTMLHEQIHNFFRGFRRDAHPMATMVGVVGALSAFYHDSLDITDTWHREVSALTDDRQAADDRGHGLQIFRRPALRFPEELAVLRRKLPAHVLLGPGRGLYRQPDPGTRHGPDHDAARRSRAERLDLDSAAGWFLGGQPLRLHRRRHRLPLGAGAWRRQPGLPGNAARDRHRRPHPGISSPRPRTRTTRSA